ncbi:MAG: hypothetical protein IJI52_00570 [Solobacterium sp.]|nr:hypothetical protein [Solobacterium sp.]MBR0214055.1 hypothetical protein [Solobacterium sp.]
MAAVLIEGVVLCFILLLVCVVNIRNGPVGGVHYYEAPVKERAAALDLITEEQIRRNRRISGTVLAAGLVILAPWMVFAVNGARSFREGFIQLTVMFLECGIFDRVFIDWYWVGHTKAWIIPGTEDLMPYISRRSWIRKIVLTVILYPVLAALLSWLCTKTM